MQLCNNQSFMFWCLAGYFSAHFFNPLVQIVVSGVLSSSDDARMLIDPSWSLRPKWFGWFMRLRWTYTWTLYEHIVVPPNLLYSTRTFDLLDILTTLSLWWPSWWTTRHNTCTLHSSSLSLWPFVLPWAVLLSLQWCCFYTWWWGVENSHMRAEICWLSSTC